MLQYMISTISFQTVGNVNHIEAVVNRETAVVKWTKQENI